MGRGNEQEFEVLFGVHRSVWSVGRENECEGVWGGA